MTAVLNNCYDFNGLEHLCALESQMDGNYNNETQLQWLKNFSAIWEKVEENGVSLISEDALPTVPDENPPISEWSDDALSEELFELKNQIVDFQLEGIENLVGWLTRAKEVQDELFSDERQKV